MFVCPAYQNNIYALKQSFTSILMDFLDLEELLNSRGLIKRCKWSVVIEFSKTLVCKCCGSCLDLLFNSIFPSSGLIEANMFGVEGVSCRNNSRFFYQTSVSICYWSLQVQTTLVRPASLALTSITCAEYIILPFFDDKCGNAPKILINLLAVALLSK